MAVSLARLSWGLWARGKDKEPVSNGSLSSSVEFEKKNKKKIASSSSSNGKWQSRDERKTMTIDSEFDFVLVPSEEEGGLLSGSDCQTSDISIGWIEPHGAGFWSGGDELDSGFAVLVPCYSRGCKELAEGSHSAVFRAITNLPVDFSPDCKEYMMEQVFPLRALLP